MLSAIQYLKTVVGFLVVHGGKIITRYRHSQFPSLRCIFAPFLQPTVHQKISN